MGWMRPMSTPRPVHRTILVFDVEGFGDRSRTNRHQVIVREGMYSAIEQAFHAVGLDWSVCDHEDRGDGVYVLVPPDVPKEQFVEAFPVALVNALDEHNASHT